MRKDLFGNEGGSALIFVMFFVLMISVLGLTTFYLTNTELTATGSKYEKAKALYLAEGGLERAVLELEHGIGNGWDDEVVGADAQSGTDDDGIMDFGSKVDCFATASESQNGSGDSYLGHYDVKIVDGRRPGESPGKCNRVIVGSDGISTKNFKRRVEAEVELWELVLPQCFVYIDGSGMDTKFDGNAFLLSGKDTNPARHDGGGNPIYAQSDGPGPDVPAILVPGWQDANSIKGEVKNDQCDQVLGIGNMDGSNPCMPSVTDLGTWNPNGFNPNRFWGKDLPKLETMVNNVIAGGTYAGHTTIGAPDNYLVTKCTGDLHTSGQFYGYGILIIEGNWVNTGKGQWDGLVIVKNECRMSGGGNGFHIFGELLIMDSSGDDGNEEFRFSGSADGYYSTATITAIQNIVRTLVVNRWHQANG